jgi:glycosyltransferase involved in cell wall biosynthesis
MRSGHVTWKAIKMSGKSNSIMLTIAMTFKNASRSLRKVLNGISRIYYSKKLIKLVFVDGGSTDGSMQILKDFIKRETKNYSKIEVESKPVGITDGRNICLNRSIGSHVLFVDSDVVVPPEIVETLTKLFKNNERLAFINVPCLREEKNMGYLDKIFLSRDETMGMSCAAINLKPLSEIGKFFIGTEIAENPLELINRFRKNGYETITVKDIRALHLKKGPGTLRTYLSVCFQTVPKLHISLLKNKDVKIMAKYSFYTILLISIVISYLYWPLPIIIFSLGVGYHLYKSKGNPISLIFLITGIILVLGVLKELITIAVGYMFKSKP